MHSRYNYMTMISTLASTSLQHALGYPHNLRIVLVGQWL